MASIWPTAWPGPSSVPMARAHAPRVNVTWAHSAGRGGCLDPIVPLEALQPLPQARASAEQDRDHHDAHVVHKPRSEEVADHGGASTEADVLPRLGSA
jgi:hypothetical protein